LRRHKVRDLIAWQLAPLMPELRARCYALIALRARKEREVTWSELYPRAARAARKSQIWFRHAGCIRGCIRNRSIGVSASRARNTLKTLTFRHFRKMLSRGIWQPPEPKV